MRPLLCLSLAGLVTFCLAGVSYGVYETPTSKDGCQIEPYAKAFGGRMLDGLFDSCDDQWYSVQRLEERVGGLNPEITLDVFVSRIENGDGIFGWGTAHGLVGLGVEVYEYTQSGYYECQAAYERYLGQGYLADEIAPDRHYFDGYHIAVKPALISRRYQSANSIVHVAACSSMTYASFWIGAREVLGYTGTVSNYLATSEANTFWSRMNGEYGKTYRYVGGARSGLTLARSGPGGGNTVLSPTVESFYPPEGTAIGRDSVAGWTVFDTRMDLSMDPSDLIAGNYYLRVKNESWSRGAKAASSSDACGGSAGRREA